MTTLKLTVMALLTLSLAACKASFESSLSMTELIYDPQAPMLRL
ncbi:MAG: hypothetical protein Q4A24_00715 [Akkermansia sp.]|nr:hypothetical protein [Akkermansia sp.]